MVSCARAMRTNPRTLTHLVVAALLAAPAARAPADQLVRPALADPAELPPEAAREVRAYREGERAAADALDAGDWAYAERLAAALERSPVATAEAPLLRARALLALGRPEEAAEAARRSLASLERAAAQAVLAEALRAAGDPEGAERAARRAVELDRGDPELRFRHAAALAELGRYAEAARAGAEVVAGDLDSPRAAQVARWAEAARQARVTPAAAHRRGR